MDPGRARSQAYRLPIHSNWYKATISHNTVLVDGQSQAPAAGRLTAFEQTSDYSAVAASCDEAYPGVRHTRWLVMTDKYLLVFDKLHAEGDHRFDWLYHNRSDAVVCDMAARRATQTDNYPGGQYIQNARQSTTDEMIRLRFEGANVTTYATLAAQEGTTVTLGEGIGASVMDRVPMTLIGRDGRNVFFAAVLEPVPAGDTPQVKGIRLEQSRDGAVMAVDLGPRTHRVEIATDDSSFVFSPRSMPDR